MDVSVLNPLLKTYILVFTGIIGLVIGSFLNVVILRLFSGESIVFPRSKCPKCQKVIAWYDNIPVLSFLLLKGKCRECKEEISLQYPIIEICTAFLFLSIVFIFGLTLKSLFLLILVCGMIVITATDLKEKLIFDITVVPLIPLGLIYNFFNIGNSNLGTVTIPLAGINSSITLNEVFISAVIGAIAGAAFFEIFSRLGLLFVGEYAFGGGDTLIGAALGAWFGWKLMIVILVISFIVQLIVGLPIIIMNMYQDKDYESLSATGVLICSMFLPYCGKMFGVTESFTGALMVTMFALILAFAGVAVIFKNLKERQSYTFLPFGPALVVGGFAVMFWGQELIDMYLSTFI